MKDIQHDDGGPAFPVSRENDGWHNAGMSLRDWFAGQALAGMLAAIANSADWDAAAVDAYEAADAMLRRRAGEGSP